jgi:hypothetical protein
MSTLVAQTISNGTVSTSSANVIQGSAKAWVNFNGTGTVAIRSSYNVSSITDNGTGDYTINFTTAMPNANYSLVATTGASAVGTNGWQTKGYQSSATGYTASSARIEGWSDGAAARVDIFQACVAVFSS